MRRGAVLFYGGCGVFVACNVWADETPAFTVASNSMSSALASTGEVLDSADGDAARARRRGHTEISAISLPAWDRSAATDVGQRGIIGGLYGNAFGNVNGNSDMPPMRVEFSHWAHASGGPGVALGVVQPGGNSSVALSGPAEVRDPSANGSTVELGLRWRGNLADQRRLDIGAWRRVSNTTPDAYTLTQTNDSALYAARVEMQFPSAKYGGLAPELGAVGMQMSGGGKVVLRAKRGGPMVYYRAKF